MQSSPAIIPITDTTPEDNDFTIWIFGSTGYHCLTKLRVYDLDPIFQQPFVTSRRFDYMGDRKSFHDEVTRQ